MTTHPPNISSTASHENGVLKEETGVDCSPASSCDSSPSFIEIYSKKRKMDAWANFGGRRNKRHNQGKEKLEDDIKTEFGHNQTWHPANVIYFIDEMYKLWQQGGLLQGNFGTKQFTGLAITMEVSAPFPSHVPWTPKQLQTKARNLRYDWRKYHDLLTRQTGWGMDPESGLIDAPEGAWEAFCEAHPKFDKELINKPFHRYQQCTDMWAPTTATGRFARGGCSEIPVEIEDDCTPQLFARGSGTNSTGKRSSRDWRDDDTTGAVKKKSVLSDAVKNSLDALSQLTEARLKNLQETKEKVDIDELNEAIFSFEDEVGMGACIRAMDILMSRREMAYAWLKWSRQHKLYWIQNYAL